MSWRSASTCGLEAVLAQRLARDRADRHDARARRECRVAAGGLQEEAHGRGGGERDVVGRERCARARARGGVSATVSYSASTSTSAPRARSASGSTSRASLARAINERAQDGGDRGERLHERPRRRSARARRRPRSRARRSARAVPGPIAATRRAGQRARVQARRRPGARTARATPFGLVRQSRSYGGRVQRGPGERHDADRRRLHDARAERLQPPRQTARLRRARA